MYRVAEYKCSVCGRTTQTVEENAAQGPLSCNISMNCNGQLVLQKYLSTRTQIVSPQLSIENTVENFVQRRI